MSYLCLVLHMFIGATLSGVGIVIVLVAGWTSPALLMGAVLFGLVLGFPIAKRVERAMTGD